MLLRRLVVVGLVGFVSFAANIATADEAMAPQTSYAALDGVSFADGPTPFGESGHFDLRFNENDSGPRFASLSPSAERTTDRDATRGYEVSLVTRAAAGLDVAIAQRGALGVNDNGDIARETRGSELRLGRGLRHGRRMQPSAQPTWYMFAASDDEALTWRPGQRNAFGGSRGGFALQDRVEIGDMQAGVTYEVYGIQASLAYVEREINVRSAGKTYSQDENFTGVTVTFRH